MWNWNLWGFWGGMWLMMLILAVLSGVVIGLVAWIVVRFTRRDSTGGIAERRTPLEIARERYARGEITKEEFDVIRRDLS
ncbi:MAG: SHOCT domain-containing protein [Chloroflexota bacterium]